MKTWQKIAIAVVITFFVAFSAGVVTGVGLSQSGKITKAPSTDPVTYCAYYAFCDHHYSYR